MKKNNCPNVAKNLIILPLLILFFVAYFLTPVSALTSETINFQGKIVRNDTGYEGLNVVAGTPACVVSGSGNDTCDFQVAYYTAVTAGTLLLTEGFTNQEIGQYDGVFELSLGSGSVTTTSQCRDGTCNSVMEVLSEYDNVYVELKFAPDGTNLTETFTRMPLEASPYAIFSQYAQGAHDAFELSTSISTNSQNNPTTGMLYYDSTALALKVYNGTSWDNIAGSLWTDAGTFTYLTATTDDLVLGGTTVADATFHFDMDASGGSYFAVDNADNSSRLFTILANGNVGIGTDNPVAKLEVAGASSAITNSSGNLTISTGGGNGNIILSPNGTGSTRIETKLGIKETGTTPTYYTYFQGGDQSADITYTLPTASSNGVLTNTSGVLSWTTTSSLGVKWNALTTPDGNLTLAHGAYTTAFSFDSITTETAFSMSSSSITSGKVLGISSSATAFTGSLTDITLSGSNAANTGSLLSINNTGTSNTNTSVLINHYATGTGNLALRVNDESGDTTPVVIDGNGRLGVGMTDPGYLFSAGSSTDTTNRFSIGSTGQFLGKTNYSSYTGDGVWNANALTNRIATPMFRYLIFGYSDGGGGQYYPSIGFGVSSTAVSDSLLILQSRVAYGTPESYNRWQVSGGGTIAWGAGSTAVDTNLYRASANILQTDDGFNIAGSVGIGDTSPASLLTVGSGDLFQVDSNGDIVKIKNLTYSWPSSHAAGVLTNNGSGTLTWTTGYLTQAYSTVQEEGTALTQRSILNFVGSGFTAADDGTNTRTNVTMDAGLNSLASLATTGIVVASATDTFLVREVAGTTDRVTVTNGTGVSGNPTIDIAATYVGQTSITTLGTVTTGTWSATEISTLKGGTGLTSYTTGDILFASAANTLSARTIGNAGDVLTVSGGLPVWSAPAAGHDALTLAAIGSTPNANAATLTNQVLNLEPASASFGGVVTTTTQTFAGNKSFNGTLSIIETGTTPTYYTTFQGGDQAGAITYTLPTASTNGVLSNTTGTLSWTDISGSLLPTGTEGQTLYNNAGVWTAHSGVYWDDVNSRLGVGTTAPSGKIHSYISNSAVTTTQYTGYFENLATNTTTDGINKYGMYITSTGTFSGLPGTSTNNYGLYVNTPSGADNNYAAIFAGGNVGIGTTSPKYSLHVEKSTSPATILVQVRNEAVGNYSGVLFATRDASEYIAPKGGVFFEGGGLNYGRGHLRFAVNNEQNNNDATLSNTVMSIINTGNVGIGDTTPASLLTVGSGDLFQVDSNGDIVKIKNLTYSWPSSHATGVLTNNGSGTLTWTSGYVTQAYATVQEEGTGLTQRSILNFVGSGFTAADDGTNTRTNVSMDADLNALADLATTGMMARTAANTYTMRTVTGTTDRVSVTNGDGVSGNPTIDIAATYVGQTSITTLGTIATGTWSANTIATTKGGTGLTSYTTGDILYASATDTLSKRGIGNAGDVLTVSGGLPVWSAPAAGHDSLTLAAIGSTPNANAATLSTQVLNLEPASASFGGVVTTTTQTFAGNKSFNGTLGIIETGTTPTYYTTFQGGDQSGAITYTLPTASTDGLLTNTSGVLSWTSASALSTKWNALTTPDGNLTLAHGAYTTAFSFDSVTTGTAFGMSSSSLTSGSILGVSSTATGMTGSLANVTLSGSNAANTGSVLTLENSGTLNTNTTLLVNHYATGTNNLAMRVNDVSADTTPFVIDGDGDVGIGTTTPGHALTVVSGDTVAGSFDGSVVVGSNTYTPSYKFTLVEATESEVGMHYTLGDAATQSVTPSTGTCTTIDNGGTTWQTVANCLYNDGQNAYTNAGSSFSDILVRYVANPSIPTGATITGVEVTIGKFEVDADDNVVDQDVKLMYNGSYISDDRADTITEWSTSETAVTYGSSTDTWNATITPAMVNSGTFGVGLVATGSVIWYGRVDYIWVTIYYSLNSSYVTGVNSSGDFVISPGGSLNGSTRFTVNSLGAKVASGLDLYIGSIGLNDLGTSNSTAGAYLVGTYDEFTFSSSTNVQDVLDDLDAAIKWTDGGTVTYLTSITDDLAVGATNTLVAPLSVDVSANTVRMGTGATANAILNMYASDADTGSITYTTNDSWAFEGGSVGIGATSPSTLLQLGTAGTLAGTLGIAGGTSGLITIDTLAAAGTWTLTLPDVDGDSGQVLTTDGSGNTSWTTVSTGSTAWDDIGDPDASSSIAHGAYLTEFTYNTIAAGSGLKLSSTSTSGTGSSSSTMLEIARSGANTDLAHSAYGIYSTVTNTNATSGTNIAGYFSASGATTANYGLIVANGNVGIGTASPGDILDVVGEIDTSTYYKLGNTKILDVENTHTLLLGQGAGFSLPAGADGNTILGQQAGYYLDSASTDQSVIIGYRAGYGTTTSLSNADVLIGYEAGMDSVSSSNNVAIGWHSAYELTSGISNVFVGMESGANILTGNYNIFLGYGASGSSTSRTESICIGAYCSTTADNQFTVGSSTGEITEAYFGEGVVSTTPGSISFNATGGSGTDIVGGDFILAGGKATGSADSGDIIFKGGVVGASGATLQTLAERMRMTDEGYFGIGDTSPASLLTVGSGDLFQVDSNGDMIKIKDVTYLWPSANASGVLTNNGSGTLSWASAGSGSLFTDSGTITWLTSTSDDLAIGANNTLVAPFSVDVSANTVRVGIGSTSNAILNMYASDGDTGSITYTTGDTWAFEGGSIAIGTTSASQALDVIGSIELQATTSSTSGVIYKGADWFVHNYYDTDTSGENTFLGRGAGNMTIGSTGTGDDGSYNVGVGTLALRFLTTGQGNIAVGASSLYANTTGDNNVSIGDSALFDNTVGYSNVSIGTYALESNVAKNGSIAIGYQAMMYADNTATPALTYNTAIGYQALVGSATPANNTGTGNTAIGHQSLTGNVGGSDNTALGVNTLNANTSGTKNVAIGNKALYSSVGRSANVAIGYEAMRYAYDLGTTTSGNTAVGAYALSGSGTASNNSGASNTAIGFSSMSVNTTGSSNVGVGTYALLYNTTGGFNVALGGSSLYLNTQGANNVAVGYGALANSETANNNIAIGYVAGEALLTGTKNIIIGYDIDLPATDSANMLNIGNLIYATTLDGSNTTLSTGNVGIGTASPGAKLDIATGTGVTLEVADPPSGYPAMNLGRVAGSPSIKSTDTWLIMDSTTSPAALNYYVNSHVVLAYGGGNVGIGLTTPSWRLHSYISNSAVTTSRSTGYFENLATNSTTDSINKYGMYVTSTGTFTGSTGTATNNYGLYIANPTGGDNNYSIYANGLAIINAPSGATRTITLSYNGAEIMDIFSNDATNAFVGLEAGVATVAASGRYNSGFGADALAGTTTGDYNTAIGYGALFNNITKSGGTAVGYNALRMADSANTGTTYNTAVGYEALYGSATASNNTGTYNTAIGGTTLRVNTSGSYLTAIGSQALYNNTTGTYNTAVGYSAGDSITTGQRNVAVGSGALAALQTGTDNIAVGTNALNLYTGSSNTAVGHSALELATGTSNTALGYQSLLGVSGQTNNGSGNVGLGYQALFADTGGSGNTAVGTSSMGAITTGYYVTGSYNTAVGYQSMFGANGGVSATAANSVAIGYAALYGAGGAAIAGTDNIAVGKQALYSLSAGDYNTVVGTFAGTYLNNSAADGNVMIGLQAGTYYGGSGSNNLTSVSNSVFIGFNTFAATASSDTNTIVIGYNTTGQGSNTTTIGNTSMTKTYLRGTNTGDAVVNVVNLTSTSSSSVSVLDLRVGTVYTATTSRFVRFYGSSTETSGTAVGNIRLNNNAVTYATSGADFAEYFSMVDTSEVGDIIMVAQDGNRRAIQSEGSILGVVSDRSGFVGNERYDGTNSNSQVVGLVGQINTKILDINGTIRKGDRITSSSIPGFGMKATRDGEIVGYALEDFDPATQGITCPIGTPEGITCGKVLVYVNVSWYNPMESISTIDMVDSGWYRIAQLSGYDDYAKLKISNTSVGSSQNLILTVDTVGNKENINIVSNFTTGGYDISKARVNTVDGTKYLEVYMGEVNGNTVKVNIEGNITNWIATDISRVEDSLIAVAEHEFNGLLFGVGEVLGVSDTGVQVSGNLLSMTGTSNIGESSNRWNDIYARGAIRLGDGVGNEGAIRFNVEKQVLELSNDGVTWVPLGDLTSQMVISPEYPGAILFADGSDNFGNMTSDAEESTGSFRNYYEWKSDREVLQDYDILVRITLPSDFVSWKEDAIYLDLMTENSASVNNNKVDMYLMGSSGIDAAVKDGISTLPGSWERVSIKALDITDCIDAGDTCTLRISLSSMQSYFVRVGDITLNYNRGL